MKPPKPQVVCYCFDLLARAGDLKDSYSKRKKAEFDNPIGAPYPIIISHKLEEKYYSL